MLNPLSVQSLHNSQGKPASAPELARALPLDTPTPIQVIKSTPHVTLSKQFTLQIQLGSNLYQLTSSQSFPAGSSALLTRGSEGQLRLSTAVGPSTPGSSTPSPSTPMQSLAAQPTPAQVNSAQTTAAHRLQIQQTLATIQRQTLPQQRPVAQALQQLEQLARATTQPPQTTAVLSRLIGSLTALFGIQSDGANSAALMIQRNLEHGGLFTERQLADPTTGIPRQDMKAQLGKLRVLAEQLPEQPRQQLLELVKGLLSRLTNQQLESVQNTRSNSDGQIERFFALDLPVRHGDRLDNVELKISEHRQAATSEQGQTRWKVQLHFDLAEQGTVDAEVLLTQDDQISARFWCSHGATATLMDDRLAQFDTQLSQQGFTIHSLHCSQGHAPTSKTAIQQLIDITT